MTMNYTTNLVKKHFFKGNVSTYRVLFIDVTIVKTRGCGLLQRIPCGQSNGRIGSRDSGLRRASSIRTATLCGLITISVIKSMTLGSSNYNTVYIIRTYVLTFPNT